MNDYGISGYVPERERKADFGLLTLVCCTMLATFIFTHFPVGANQLDPWPAMVQAQEEHGSAPQLGVGYEIFFTSYNPQVAQTDSTPCIGASGKNICTANQRSIALSRDLVSHRGNTPFHYGDLVYMVSQDGDSRCNGYFRVEDTMNKRFRGRGDLFFMQRKDNTSCTAVVHRVL